MDFEYGRKKVPTSAHNSKESTGSRFTSRDGMTSRMPRTSNAVLDNASLQLPARDILTPQLAQTAVAAQRKAVAPTLQAAAYAREDREHLQRAGEQLTVQRASLERAQGTLGRHGLAAEPLHLLERRTPPGEPTPAPLTPLDLHERTLASQRECLALLRRDAHFLPFHRRAELCNETIEAGRRIGLNAESLKQFVLAKVSNPYERETLNEVFVKQQMSALVQVEARQNHDLQLAHARLQRLVQQTQQEHQALNQQAVVERIESRRGSGQSLPDDVRKQLELGLNHDLTGLRIHIDDEADLIAKGVGAVAFASGKDIYFQQGEFNPAEKFELLAHEATHVKQQDLGQVAPGIDIDAGLEAEAQQFGERAAREVNIKGGQIAVTAKTRTAERPATRTPEKDMPGGPSEEAALRLPIQRLGTPAEVKGSATAARQDVVGAAAMTWVRTHPEKLAMALQTGMLTYFDPRPNALPRHYTVARLKGVFDALSVQALLTVRGVMQAQAGGTEFYRAVARAFGGNYALSIQKRIGIQNQLSRTQLTVDAFVEQLTNRASYMNDDDLGALKTDQDLQDSDNDGNTQELESQFQGQKLLAFFGYRSGPHVLGQWGFQMRVFTPIPLTEIKDPAVRARRQQFSNTIVVFRGTEGVQLNGKEGGVDTLVGDAARASVGLNQVNMNADLIRVTLAQVNKAIFGGHSLGGGIAQVVASKYPTKVARVITFQSPGLPTDMARSFTASNASKATHYRVAGDIVPNAGQTVLPGQIEYVTRFEKEKGSAEFEPAINMTASHVAFPLATMLQGIDPGKRTPEQDAILNYGAHDRQELASGAQARMTYSGAFETDHDPRTHIEWARDTAGPVILGDAGYTLDMAEANIGYNVLLEGTEERLKKAASYAEFRKVYAWLDTVTSLRLSKKQEQFLEDLGIRNTTPVTYPIEVNSPLIDKISIPMPGLMANPTFLNVIRANGGKVKIETADINRLKPDLIRIWRNWHPGQRFPKGYPGQQ